MSYRALWFGPERRPLFARCYGAEGEVRGCLVLCPPIGVEAQASLRAFQCLGESLAEAGFAVLQLDYDGTGDSAGGADDPGRVNAWKGSIRAAVEMARGGGADFVGLVGMRMGATLALSVAAELGIDALVLWDPCESGRAFLREQILLRAIYLADQGLDSQDGHRSLGGDLPLEILGSVLQPETVRNLGELSIAAPGDPVKRVLALLRPERPPRQAVLGYLDKIGAELGEAAGQEALLGIWPMRSLIPRPSVMSIVTWLSSITPSAKAHLTFQSQTGVQIDGAGGALSEEICHLGPHRLFGVLTRAGPGPAQKTLVLLNSGPLDHTGPGRLWTDLARRWARPGLQVLRVDLSGLGDSPPMPGQQQGLAYMPSAVAEISDIAYHVSSGEVSRVFLMGLCSGAYHAILAGDLLGVGGVIALNPSGVGQTPGNSEQWAPAREPSGSDSVAGAVRVGSSSVEALARRILRHTGSDSGVVRQVRGVARRTLDVKWWFATRFGKTEPITKKLRLLVNKGVPSWVICRHYEGRLVSRGQAGPLRRMRRSGSFTFLVLPTTDHTLFIASSRQEVLGVLEAGWLGSLGEDVQPAA